MFDLNATDGSVKKKKYQSPIEETDETPDLDEKSEGLDSAETKKLHKRLIDMFSREQARQYDNRREQAEDEDYYDNKQWSDEDAAYLRERGQVPLVYNVISASIDWITGTEKRTRTDYKVLPRKKEHSTPAERKTQLLKYLADTNRTPFHRSRAFEDAAKVGLGWLESGIERDATDEPLYTRYEAWRNILFDSAATEMDLSDARYIFRVKWVDLDVAEVHFKDRKHILNAAKTNAPGYFGLDEFGDDVTDQHEAALDEGSTSLSGSGHINGYDRQRIRLVEAWIRLPAETEKLKGGLFNGEIYDPFSEAHIEAVKTGESEIVETPRMRMHVAIFTTSGMLYFDKSPYRHDRFPFTPIWAYRRGRDGMPYGVIRRLKDIQQDVNKRASKALAILSSNKVIMEDGAVDDIDELAEEVARPDGIIVVNSGKKIELNAERELAAAHLDLMSRDISMIQQASGVTDELLGRRTNATSGKAILARQDQGSMATAKLFDNLLFADQVRGEKELANIEQFMDEKKAFRITNQRGTPQYIEINDGLPENDIIRTKADFILSETDWRATTRQAAVDQLMETMTRFPPEVSMAIIDLVIENMDLPNSDEIVQRIRNLTGAKDPDADPDKKTEEEIAAEAAAAEQAAALKKIAELDIADRELSIVERKARIDQITGKTVTEKVIAQQKAVQVAKDVIAVPMAADISDHVLEESGFTSKTTAEENAAIEAAAAEQAMAEQQADSAMQQEVMAGNPEQLPEAQIQ